MVYKKGFDNLVRSMAAVRAAGADAQLLIAGDGPLRDDLLRAATESGVADSVHLVGAVSHADLPELYSAADIVAVPSVHGPGGNVDGLPNVFLEGFASGTAVVAQQVAAAYNQSKPHVACNFPSACRNFNHLSMFCAAFNARSCRILAAERGQVPNLF